MPGTDFRIYQDALVTSVGALAERVHGPATAAADVVVAPLKLVDGTGSPLSRARARVLASRHA